MYDQSLVKHNKRKKTARLVSGICSIGVIAMCIVAFLGRRVGTFTINLKNDGVNLTMDNHSDFKHKTSYLHITDVDYISGPHSYVYFETSKSCSFNDINNENTPFDMGKEPSAKNGIRFFKYTFFVLNDGTVDAGYTMSINLLDNQKPKNYSYALDEYLRVMIFEEGSDPSVYAKRSLTVYDATHDIYRENVCGPEGSSKDRGLADLFVSDEVLAEKRNSLEVGQHRMYTVLFWLEGEDPECKYLPDTASLKIGVTINGYPNI